MTRPQVNVNGDRAWEGSRRHELRLIESRPVLSNEAGPGPLKRWSQRRKFACRKTSLRDINELARRLSIPKGTLYNWVYLRRIPFVKLGRALRFNPEEIERIVRSSSTLEVAGRR
jgi:excisionase family DNA binding protein